MDDRHSGTWTIFGAGNFSSDIIEAIESGGGTVVRLVLNAEVDEALISKLGGGIEVSALADFTPATDRYCFGFINPQKQALLAALSAWELDFPNIVHSFAWVSPRARLGRGNFIGAGVVVAPHARLGDFNFINRCATVGHDTAIGSFTHVGPNAALAGRCRVGDRSFLGIGSSVIDGVTIGDDVTLGAGAAAVKDLTEAGTYVGVPARRLDRL